LIQEYDSIAGTNFTNDLSNFLLDRHKLEESARRDMRQVLTPQLLKERNALRDQLKRAEKQYAPLAPLSPMRLQAAMKNLDRKQPNLLTERAFEELDRLNGTNFRQEIEDRNILDMFMKEDKAGSRKTNLSTVVVGGLSSLLGLGAAGPLGAIAGAMGGATLDIYGGQLLKGLVDKNPGNITGLLFVEKALNKNAQKINNIPGILERMSKTLPSKVNANTIAIDALWRILEKTDPEDKPKQKSLPDSVEKLSEISEKVGLLLSDPQILSDHLETITEGLMIGGAPSIASGFASTAQRTLQYLQAVIPKPPKPSSPFMRRVKWSPPDYELFGFAQKLEVLENPFVVLDHLENGTLTRNHIEALKNVFPEILKEIQNKVSELAMSGTELSMNYDKRIKLSLLLGVDFDSSLEPANVNYLQSTFEQENLQNPETNHTMFKPKIGKNFANNQMSQFQQIGRIGK